MRKNGTAPTYVDQQGYIHEWTPDGYRRQHRLRVNAPPGSIVHHKDGNPANNEPSNLEVFPSHSEHAKQHQAERKRLGIKSNLMALHGEESPRAKLTADQVREIRSLKGTLTNRQIGARFGVSKVQVGFILRGERWAHIQ